MKHLLILPAALLALTACNGENNSANNSVDIPNAAKSETESSGTDSTLDSMDAPATKTFSGETGKLIKVTSPLNQYSVDIKLKSDQVVEEREYDDTYPPMPGIIGEIAIMEKDGRYELYIPSFSKPINVGTPSEWTRISLVCDGSDFSYYVNGSLGETSEGCPVLNSSVRIGKGFKQRVWIGEMEYFDVYSGDQSETLFSDKMSIPASSRIVSLEDLE